MYGPGVTMDAAGNALVVWPNGSDVVWRRSAHGSGEWAATQRIEDQDPYYVTAKADAAGNVMVAWGNALGLWASRFE
jgi:hypothetical protein